MGLFKPKHIKEGKLLLKGVAKFVHYKRDILSEEKLREIERQSAEFRELLGTADKATIEKKAKELQRVCERAVPMPPHSALRENVEVFFVAIVIALGIRAYFLQPFKIPTGSMQPTLNGIIGFSVRDDAAWEKVKPNLLEKGWDLLWHGRNYVNVVADEDFRITGIRQSDHFKFFSFTHIERTGLGGQQLEPIKIWAPMTQVLGDLGLAKKIRLGENASGSYLEQGSNGGPPRLSRKVEMALRDGNIRGGEVVRKGEVLVRGYIDTGDQVLVNKFSYHFRKPDRGEVFVFTTQGIRGINPDPNAPSQHYIKRLCALPGDTWDIDAPNLYVNGELAKEAGAQRVMHREGPENEVGYSDRTGKEFQGRLGPKEYLALGDNSYESSDSRAWGPVPESNLVGPALFVYWPFAEHFGLIH